MRAEEDVENDDTGMAIDAVWTGVVGELVGCLVGLLVPAVCSVFEVASILVSAQFLRVIQSKIEYQ